MLEASLFGFLGASSLLIGALLTMWLRPSRRVIGAVMAFGAGTLISAIAYELVLDAIQSSRGFQVALGLAAGALTFFAGDLMIDRSGGADRKRSSGAQADGSGLAIVLGTFLD